jgi:Ran GTPase-activating protein (RanGAP) involved in mRNA processing and transport
MNVQLTVLDVSINHLGVSGAKLLANGLANNVGITCLNAGFNFLGNEGVEFLAMALKKNDSITSLNLGFNEIDHEGADDLADTLLTNFSLVELDLEHNEIGDRGAQQLAGALRVNRTLAMLDLRDNQISAVGAGALEQVRAGNPALELLDLSFNVASLSKITVAITGTEERTDPSGFGYVSFTLSIVHGDHTWTLRRRFLDFDYLYSQMSRTDVADVEFPGKWHRSVLSTTTLDRRRFKLEKFVHLVLEQGSRTALEMMYTFLEVEQNSSKCTVDKQDAHELLEQVSTDNKKLVTLNFRDTQLADEGSVFLARALKANSTLTVLTLVKCAIGAIGAQILAEVLQSNSTVTALDLSLNNLGPQGGSAVSDIIRGAGNAGAGNGATPKGDAQMTAEQVAEWLGTIGLPAAKVQGYADSVLENAVDGATMDELEKDDLKDIGVGNAIHRAKIFANWREQADMKKAVGGGSPSKGASLRANHSQIKVMRLGSNRITTEGAATIAEALKFNFMLRQLEMDNNDIAEAGTGELAAALNVNTTLTSLSVGTNNLGPVGAGTLADALKAKHSNGQVVCSPLKCLALHGNDIGYAPSLTLILRHAHMPT